jgi:hypothetical protein
LEKNPSCGKGKNLGLDDCAKCADNTIAKRSYAYLSLPKTLKVGKKAVSEPFA